MAVPEDKSKQKHKPASRLDVPAPLKLILATFLSFAALLVLTAKDHRAVFHYVRGRRHLPEPLRVTIKKRVDDKSSMLEGVSASREDSDGGATARPSYVEQEKRLKRQLLQLLSLQKEERMQHNGRRNPNIHESVLGVPISNRYLGEDLLPFPANKGSEEEWMQVMEGRKEKLRIEDELEWKEVMRQYEEIMEGFVDYSNHSAGTDAHSTVKQLQQQPTINLQQNSWPSPLLQIGPNSTILLTPSHGFHNPISNAIFVFAEGYDLSIYLAFIESLSNSGYVGDLVLSISTEPKLKAGVKDYLTSDKHQNINIVIYEVEWDCYKQSGELATGSNEGINHCRMNHVFGDGEGRPVEDPRVARPVATARYELYWLWSIRYESESWIMLIDARDAWFQLDPFRELEKKGSEGDGGELHLFGVSACC